MAEKTIFVKDFKKSFGSKLVIDNLSFEVDQGEIFAFLGANGSGKTTTIRSLLRIYTPDEGELLINGMNYTQELSNEVGYLPEERGLYNNSKVLETIVYFGELKGLSKAESTKRARDFLQRVGLSDKENILIKRLSSGQQQKIQLGITVINKPSLLILDEPTKGLDPLNRVLLMELLFELNKEGTTILFSTHQMEEVEKIANRLLMIKNGKKALYGNVMEVKESFGNNIISMNFSGELQPENEFYTASVNKNFAEITPKQGKTRKEILKNLMSQNNLEVISFTETTPSLNEVFISVLNDNKF